MGGAQEEQGQGTCALELSQDMFGPGVSSVVTFAVNRHHCGSHSMEWKDLVENRGWKGAPCESRKTVLLVPILWQAIPVTIRPDCGCWAETATCLQRVPEAFECCRCAWRA